MPFKMHKPIYFFSLRKFSLPNILRPVTRNTLIFVFALLRVNKWLDFDSVFFFSSSAFLLLGCSS